MENNDQILDPNTRAELPIEMNPQNSGGNPVWKNRTIIFSTIGAIVVVAIIGWYFLFAGKKPLAPTSNNVVLLMKGPDQLVSGNEAEYHVVYRNGENADLVNISLEMFYPSGFKFKSASPSATSTAGNIYNLPVLKEGKDGEVVIRGKLTGATGENKQIKAVLHYKLSNFNSEFAVNQTLQTAILPPNITMDVNGPVDVVQGQDTTYTVTLTNVTNQDFDNLVLTASYPDGFLFTSSSLPPSKDNNYWKLPKLVQNSSISIDITGSFTGNISETKLVKIDLGEIINNNLAPQLTSTATFHIIPSSLSIAITSDAKENVVNLGQNINYKVSYANQGNIGLNNLTIVVNLEGPALDIARLSANNAIISNRTITWKAATLPGLNVLSPSERGEVTFSVPISKTLSTNLKNQTVRATAQITSDEMSKPTKAGDINLKLASQLDLAINGEYVSGAAPMQVGKTTLFSMTYLLSNSSNDLSNTKVIAGLPLPASAWKNVIIPDSEKNRLSYDPNSGKITWNIGDVSAFVGKFSPALSVTFQLEVNPTESDRGKDMDLLTNIQATGNDNFTTQPIHSSTINDVSTSNLDDDVLDAKGATVK